jgi:hypothetical protein
VIRRRGSIIAIATGYRLDNQGVGVQALVGLRIFTSLYRQDKLWGPPNNGYWGLLHGVKPLGYEAYHSPQTTAKVKHVWVYISISPNAIMV